MPTQQRRAQSGFTLVELMVVVLVIGILLAIAIPTFLGARERGQDSVARTSLRTAQVAAASLLASDGAGDDEFEDMTPAEVLGAEEPSLTFLDGGESTGPKVLSFHIGQGWGALAALSESGTCFFVIGQDEDGGVTWTEASVEDGELPCGGESAPAAAGMVGAFGDDEGWDDLDDGDDGQGGGGQGKGKGQGRGGGRDDAPGQNK